MNDRPMKVILMTLISLTIFLFSYPPKVLAQMTNQAQGQVLIKFKRPPEITFEKEISFTIPVSGKKVVLREEGIAVKGMSSITSLNKKLKVKSLVKLGKTKEIEKIALMEIPEVDIISEALALFGQDKNIDFAEPNYIYQGLFTPNDPYFSESPLSFFQWNLARVNMQEAWNFQPRGGSSITKVAVIDSGVAFENYFDGQTQFALAPELSQTNFVAPMHFNSTQSCDASCNCTWLPVPQTTTHPNDDVGHGSHVTSVISQLTNNGAHSAGISDKVSIIPIKVLNSCALGLVSDIVRGIDHAVANGASVINLSLGSPQGSSSLHDAIISADQAGSLMVSASGNSADRTSSPPIFFPAAYPEVVAVGATRWDNMRANYSNFGPELDLVAPGGQVVNDQLTNFLDQNGDLLPDGVVQQTIKPSDYTQFTQVTDPGQFGLRCVATDGSYVWIDENCGLYQGTSIAVPHVSAASALVFSVNPSLTNSQAVNIIKSSTSKSAIPNYNSNEHGEGLLDVAASLSLAALRGDANNDGRVDGLDLSIWLNNFGMITQNGSLDADFDNNGFVDGSDYLLWLGSYVL